jgi:hypothetical protein
MKLTAPNVSRLLGRQFTEADWTPVGLHGKEVLKAGFRVEVEGPQVAVYRFGPVGGRWLERYAAALRAAGWEAREEDGWLVVTEREEA